MFTDKSVNDLDNQSIPPTTAKVLDEGNFFIGAIFDISNEVKINNQQINTITQETNAKWSVTLNTNETNICYRIDSDAQGRLSLSTS